MYIRIKPRKSFFKLSQVKPPIVKKIVKSKNSSEDDIFEIELSCPVDKDKLIKSPVDKIEVEFTSNKLNHYKKQGQLSSLKIEKNLAKEQNKQYKDTTQENNSSNNSNKLEKESQVNFENALQNFNKNIKKRNKDLFNDTKKVGSFVFIEDSSKIKNFKNSKDSKKIEDRKRDLFGERKVLKRTILNSQKSKDLKNRLKKEELNFRKVYKDFYNRCLINAIIDPSMIFEESHEKTSVKMSLKGKEINSSPYVNSYAQVFNPVFNGIKNEIIDLSNVPEVMYSIDKEIKTIDNLKTTIKISRRNLLNMKEDSNILLKAKEKSGLTSITKDYKIKKSEILIQENKYSKEFDLNLTRNKSDNTKINLSSNNKGSVSIFQKVVKNSELSKDMEFLEKRQEIKFDKDRVQLNDSIEGRKNKNLIQPSQDVFYRATINYKDTNFSNAKSRLSKSKNNLRENIPQGTIYAFSNERERSIDVFVNNISSNVARLRVVKQRIVGKSLKDYSYILNSEGNQESDYKFLEGDSFKITDFDVFDGANYKYSVECIMKNGEIKFMHNSFIEKFEERSETVSFLNENVEQSIREDNRNLTVTVTLSKIKNQVDEIFSNLFGDVFTLFKSELQKIKDISSLIYSVEVIKIDKNTGESKTIQRITVGEDNIVSFKDSIKVNQNIFYKLIPRVLPASEVIDKINERIEKAGKNEVFDKINNSFSTLRRLNINTTKSKVSSKNIKNQNIHQRRKGLTVSKDFDLESNKIDFFGGSSTGDIYYIEINKDFSEDVSIKKSSIKEITGFKNNEINSLDNIQDQEFKLSINVGSDLDIDFYKIYIKEDNHVYLDGIMHSTDDLSNDKTYYYLVNHKGSLGFIEYFLVPVTKKGDILKPKLISSQIIE